MQDEVKILTVPPTFTLFNFFIEEGIVHGRARMASSSKHTRFNPNLQPATSAQLVVWNLACHCPVMQWSPQPPPKHKCEHLVVVIMACRRCRDYLLRDLW